MTVDTGHVRRSSQATAVKRARQGPTARRADAPPEQPATASEITWTRVGRDRYRVTRADDTLGFIDVEGGVYVALAGSRYDRAIEASQTLSFDDAVNALEDRHPAR